MSSTLIDVMWFIPFAVVCLTVGIGIALASCIAHDRIKEDRIKKMVYDRDSWCQDNCRHYAECYSVHEDPDDAWKELEDYCCQCPMAKAIDVWEQEQKKRGKQ